MITQYSVYVLICIVYEESWISNDDATWERDPKDTSRLHSIFINLYSTYMCPV